MNIGKFPAYASQTKCPSAPTHYAAGDGFTSRIAVVANVAGGGATQGSSTLRSYPLEGFGFGDDSAGTLRPGHRIFIWAPTFAGKTYMMLFLLALWFAEGITRFVIMSGSEGINRTYSKVFGEGTVFDHANVPAIKKLIEEQKRLWAEWAKTDQKSSPPRCILLLDDVVMQLVSAARQKKDPWFTELFTNGRHFGITIVIASQQGNVYTHFRLIVHRTNTIFMSQARWKITPFGHPFPTRSVCLACSWTRLRRRSG
jgi:hypothetical protein